MRKRSKEKKIILLLVILIILFSWVIYDKFYSKYEKLSVVVVVADDFGIGDISKQTTPFLFQLKEDNLYYSRFITQPRCTPTRMSFLNGYSSSRLGVNYAYNCKLTNTGGDLRDYDITMPELLQQNNFKTAIVGKWHMGDQFNDHPLNNGYDYFFGSISGALDYNSHIDLCGNHDLSRNFDDIVINQYLTDLIQKEALSWIKLNKDVNYFLYIPFTVPHWWYQMKGEVFRLEGGELTNNYHNYEPTYNRYKYMLNSLDSSCRNIYNAIGTNTTFIFLGDNGGHNKFYSNGSLRGDKGTSFNGGVNTPLIVASKKFNFKGENTNLFTILDLSSTLLKHMGIKKENNMEGRELIFGPQDNGYTEYYIKNEGGAIENYDSAVFYRNWKAVFTGNDEFLFNIDQDWEESKNLKYIHEDTLLLLKQKYSSWNNENK